MANTEEKIVKIIDETTHSRGASVDQIGDKGALIVKAVDTTVGVDLSGQTINIEGGNTAAVNIDGGNGTPVNVTETSPLDISGLATESTLSSVDGNVNTIAGAMSALATTDSVQALGTAMVDNTQVTQIVNASGDAVTVTGNKLDVNAVLGENLPTEGQNPSLVLAYNIDGQVETITKTIGGTPYVKTLTYTGGVLTNISVWV